MSRSGYSDDCENVALWRAAVRNAINGRRGQEFLREMLAALDAMPEKRLVAEALRAPSGEVCAMGSVGAARGLDMSEIDAGDPYAVAPAFGIAPAMAAEIAFVNDEMGPYDRAEDPAERWARVRQWVQEQVRG